MIHIKSLSYYLGGRTLYEDVTLPIQPHDKIGLVGRNGTGKSTLLRMIAKQLSPSRGEIEIGKGVSIGFLNQDLLAYQTTDSIREVAMQAFGEALALQKEMDELIVKMDQTCDEATLAAYGEAQERFVQIGGYDMESQTDQMLEKMGFMTADLKRPFNTFSGGWRMRVIFAKLLLESPSLLLLDEPTNHLDIVSIQWVEEYLRSYPNALMVVSHDREFLDATTNTTWEVAQEDITVYPGNYTFFTREKAQRLSTQEKAFNNQQKEIKRQEEFIQRFRAKSSKAKLVQSRIKSLDKMEKVAPIEVEKVNLRMRFALQQTSGREVAKLEGISKAFGDLVLLEKANAQVLRGDRIALIGKNGKGKSTVLKLIAQELPLDDGLITLGHQVTLGYHTQHHLESLNPAHTLLECMQTACPNLEDGYLRAILGAFLFQKEDIYKKVQVLSGGEKARLSLAKLLALAPNFILLDEPTNHLDMIAIDLLSQALQKYQGTLLFVSHNRYFIQEVATQIWYLQDHQIKVYHGRYEDFVKDTDIELLGD